MADLDTDADEVITPSEIIAGQQDYVTDFINQGNSFIDKVADIATTTFNVDTDVAPLNYQWDRTVQDFLSSVTALKPNRPSFTFTPVLVPEAPVITDVTISPVEVADFVDTSPTVNIPQAPSAVLPSAPSAPTFVEPSLPSAPTLSMPVAPSFASIVLPEPPSIAIPAFTFDSPIDDLVTPSNTFSFYEQTYQSTLLDATRAKLLYDLENGGYGIEPEDENALWERARTREVIGGMAEMDELYRTTAQRGFALPPGELMVNIQRSLQNVQDKISTINRDISIKRADMFVENRKFTLQESRELEAVLINYHNSLMERTLNAAKATLDAQLSVFKTLVERYNARLDAYKTEAQVFEARVRAALAQVEIYRTTMEGKRIELESQHEQVEIYRAQLSGIETIVNIYRTQTEVANVQATIQRTKLEAFRAQVDAFAQQVQARVAEFNMYESRIRGEVAKVTVFDSQVRAYTAQVEASKVKADIQVANVRAEVDQAQARIAIYNGQIDEFKSNLAANLALLRSDVDVYQADNTAYSTTIDALRSSYQLQLEDVKRQDTINIEKSKVNLELAQFQLRQLVEAAQIRNNAAQFGSDFYRTIVASTLSSINALAVQNQSI